VRITVPEASSLRRHHTAVFHHCGGTIVSAEYVVTAAHCILGYGEGAARTPDLTAPDILVHAADHNNREYETGEQKREVEAIMNHPLYQGQPKGLSHDITILKLKQPVCAQTLT
jgi:secreted trypsin-like serine protease